MNNRRLLEQTERDLQRLINKEKRPAGWIGVLFYGGTLGLLLVTPLILGAYFGRWLDTLADGYSVRWTVNFILLGLGIGAYNVYHFIQRH